MVEAIVCYASAYDNKSTHRSARVKCKLFHVDHPRKTAMRRRLLGIIAFALLVGGSIGLYLAGGSTTQLGLFLGACARSGALLGALWLAFPRIVELSERVPPWLLGSIVVGGLAIMIRPRNIVLVGPLLMILAMMHFMGWLFRPISKTRVRNKTEGRRDRGTERPRNGHS